MHEGSKKTALRHGRRATLRALLGLTTGAMLLPRMSGSAMAATAAPRRIVSVGGALTEIVYALDAQAELVGVDTTSLYPQVAQQLPSVGYARALSAEGVLALAPTQLIVTEDAGPAPVLRQISGAGVPVATLAANHQFAGLLDRVGKVGALTGRERQAALLTQRLQSDWKAAMADVARATAQRGGAAKAPRVLFILAHAPNSIMVGGRGTAAAAMIGYIDAVNAADGFSGYKPLTPEAAIAARPDVIVLTDQGLQANGGVDGILALPGLAQTPAGKARRVLALEAMYLLGFGPRLPAAVAQLDAAVNQALRASGA
jgi:iron complex transport system substrate-binding protein